MHLDAVIFSPDPVGYVRTLAQAGEVGPNELIVVTDAQVADVTAMLAAEFPLLTGRVIGMSAYFGQLPDLMEEV